LIESGTAGSTTPELTTVELTMVELATPELMMVELHTKQKSALDHSRFKLAGPDEYHTRRRELISDCLEVGPGSSALGQFLEGPLNPW
jgi:hypothetical protein